MVSIWTISYISIHFCTFGNYGYLFATLIINLRFFLCDICNDSYDFSFHNTYNEKYILNIRHINALDIIPIDYGPLARYVKLRVAHAPGMSGTCSPPPRFSDPDMHHGTCARHVPWCMLGSLTTGFLRSRWRGKRPRHSRHMRSP